MLVIALGEPRRSFQERHEVFGDLPQMLPLPFRELEASHTETK